MKKSTTKKAVKKTAPKPTPKAKPVVKAPVPPAPVVPAPKPVVDRASKITMFNARADKAEAAAAKLEAKAAASRARAGRVRAHAVKYANGGTTPSPITLPPVELPKGDAPGQTVMPEVEAAVSVGSTEGEDLL